MTANQSWRVLGASLPGARHLSEGKPCQDAHIWRETINGVLILGVADGAGSASLAEIGANAALSAAVAAIDEAIRDNVPEPADWPRLLFEAATLGFIALAREAAARQRPTRDFATTLILAVASEKTVAAFQIGDGAVVVQYTGDQILSLTHPEEGEHVNETTFLTSNDAFASYQCVVRDGAQVEGLILLTDGLQNLALKMPQGEPHAPFFAPFLRFAASSEDDADKTQRLKRFLLSSRVTSRTDDDLTLLIAIPLVSEVARANQV